MIEGRASGFYDETEIAGRLAALPPAARTLFACACAERLMSAFRWFCERVGSPSYDFVREALNGAWSPGDPVRATGEREVAELVPDDDDGDLALGSAVAQNAVACVAYALGVRQTGEVQKAVWAARQLYDAADSVVQQGSAVQTYVKDVDQEPPVQLMLGGIHAALDVAGSASSADLLVSARHDGDAFLGFVAGRHERQGHR